MLLIVAFLISEDSKIWIDKWFRIQTGIRNLKTDNIVWFNKGIFAINNPTVNYNLTSKKLSFDGNDLMSTLDVSLGIPTKIPKEVGISNAIKMTVQQLGKISSSQIYIEQNDLEMPFDIEKDSTDTVYSLIEGTQKSLFRLGVFLR